MFNSLPLFACRENYSTILSICLFPEFTSATRINISKESQFIIMPLKILNFNLNV